MRSLRALTVRHDKHLRLAWGGKTNADVRALADTGHQLVDVSGEYVRADITDGQEGVELIIDIQVVDTTTCEPLANVALEAWACNATVSLATKPTRPIPNDPGVDNEFSFVV